MITFKQYNILKESKHKIVTFDFDWTLSSNNGTPNSIGIKLLKKHADDENTTVNILTTRKDTEQNDKEILMFLKSELGIYFDKLGHEIFFTNGKDKADFITNLHKKGIDVDTHYDEDPYEIKLINRRTETRGILVDIDNKLKDQWKEEYGVSWDQDKTKDEADYNALRWDAGDFCEDKLHEGIFLNRDHQIKI